MTDKKKTTPSCFGVLDAVFSMGIDGLRNTPEACFACSHKTTCLRTAMSGSGGLKVREELVDRAYELGMMTFFDRWSKKKDLRRRIKGMRKKESGTNGSKS